MKGAIMTTDKVDWDNKFGIIETKQPEFVNLEDNYTQRMQEQSVAEKVIINGVGKDAEIVTNEKGGKQSKSPMAMHLVDPMFLKKWFNKIQPTESRDEVIEAITDYMILGCEEALTRAILEVYCLKQHIAIPDKNGAIVEIAKVLQEGATKYEANNWRLIPQEEHINHALIHYQAYLMGDTQDEHLAHCMCRLMMAFATKKSKGFDYTTYISKQDMEKEDFYRTYA